MKKKPDIFDILFSVLFLFLIALLICIIIKPSIAQKIYIFFDRYRIIKENPAQIGTYYDMNHPNCFLTKEATSNKKSCLNNNGVWLYNSKTCLCRPIEVI